MLRGRPLIRIFCVVEIKLLPLGDYTVSSSLGTLFAHDVYFILIGIGVIITETPFNIVTEIRIITLVFNE